MAKQMSHCIILHINKTSNPPVKRILVETSRNILTFAVNGVVSSSGKNQTSLSAGGSSLQPG